MHSLRTLILRYCQHLVQLHHGLCAGRSRSVYRIWGENSTTANPPSRLSRRCESGSGQGPTQGQGLCSTTILPTYLDRLGEYLLSSGLRTHLLGRWNPCLANESACMPVTPREKPLHSDNRFDVH